MITCRRRWSVAGRTLTSHPLTGKNCHSLSSSMAQKHALGVIGERRHFIQTRKSG
jgi:hypothetical protein